MDHRKSRYVLCSNFITDSLLSEENRFKSIDQLIEKFQSLKDEFPYMNSNSEINNFIKGEKKINIHAVSCVIRALVKTIQIIDKAMDDIRTKDDKHNRRMILLMSFKLAAFFDFIYSAMISDKKEIFWRSKPSENLEMTFSHYRFEEATDLDKHMEETTARLENFDYMVAVASKGLSSGSLIKQVFNGIRFALKYRNDREATSKTAKFFMNVFKEKTLFRMLKVSEMDIVKSQAKKGYEKCELDKKIYIPVSECDVLNLENLDDTSTPKMIEEDLDLPCTFTKDSYDPNTTVKFRITYDCDWMAVDWKGK